MNNPKSTSEVMAISEVAIRQQLWLLLLLLSLNKTLLINIAQWTQAMLRQHEPQ